MKRYRCDYCMAGPCTIEMQDCARHPSRCVHNDTAKWKLVVAPVNASQHAQHETCPLCRGSGRAWMGKLRAVR